MENTPGMVLEGNIESWIRGLDCPAFDQPYIWPGSWPDNDLRDMANALPGWHFGSAWIYYECWDPEIPGAVERFNRSNQDYRARVFHEQGIWHPPRDVIAVLPREAHEASYMQLWLISGLKEKTSCGIA